MKGNSPQRGTEKERFWRDAIRQQRRSGRSIRDYCRDQGLSEPSFYAWRRELVRRGVRRAKRAPRPAAKRPAFVSVTLAPGGASSGSTAIECLLPNGVVLRLPVTMDPAAIAAVVTGWEQSRC